MFKRNFLKRCLSTLCCVSLLSAPALAQSQGQNQGQNQSSDQSEMKVPTNIGARNISAFTRNIMGRTTVGGYFDTEYYFPADGNSHFDQHRFILQVSSFLHDRLFFNTEIEYEHGAIINGGTNDGELKIEQTYLDYKIEDWLVLRSGVILVPLGRLNIYHDSDFRDTTARPLFNRVIVPTTWMEPGAGFYGTMYPNEDWEVTYEAYVMQGLLDQLKDGKGLRSARPSLASDNNNNKSITTRIGLSPFIGLDFGVGGYYAQTDAQESKHLGLFVGDFSYTNGPWEFLGEAGFSVFSPTTYTKDEQEVALNGPMWGYYLEGHYHLFPDWLKGTFLGEDFENPVFTLFGRIGQVDTDMSTLNENDLMRLTFGANYRPTSNTVFKLEYQWNIETQALLKQEASKEASNNQIIASVAVGF